MVSEGTLLGNNDGVEDTPKRLKVGLALSGGGAKGAAHIPVLRALEKAGIPIDYIAGTSVGAIIGALYAIGYTPDELEVIFRETDWGGLVFNKTSRTEQVFVKKKLEDMYILDLAVSPDNLTIPTGLLDGKSVYEMLNSLLLGYQEVPSFDDLPIPFACVSYDMIEGKQFVSRGGNLPLAIRASISIPGVFTPVEIDKMQLVDGGVYNNLPTDIVRQMGADLIIAVDITSGNQPVEHLDTFMDIFDRLTTIVGRDKYRESLEEIDLYIQPDIRGFTAASISLKDLDTLFNRGQVAVDQKWDEILEFKSKIGLPDDFTPKKIEYSLVDSTMLQVGEISFEGFTSREKKRAKRFWTIQPNSTTTKKELNDNIDKIKKTGGYTFVHYTLDGQAPYNLSVVADNRKNANIEVGIRFDTKDMASIIFNTSLTIRGERHSPKVSLTARLSKNPYIKVIAQTDQIVFGAFGFSYMFNYNNFNFYESKTKTTTSSFGLHRTSIFFSDIFFRNLHLKIGVDFDYFDYRSSFYKVGDELLELKPQSYFNYMIMGQYDSLDDLYYPTKGYSMRYKYTFHSKAGDTPGNDVPFSSMIYGIMGAFTPFKNLTISPAFYGRTLIGPTPTYPYLNAIGGTIQGRYLAQQLPFIGIQNIELCENSIIIAAIKIRYDLFKKHHFTLHSNFMSQHDYFGNMFEFQDILWGFGLEYSYQTSLGPLSVLVSGTNKNPWGGIYLSLGKVF